MFNSKKVPRTYLVARITVFAALSVVGSFIHLYSSLAFDSAPGFFAALYFGPLDGFCVFGVGHLATAIVSGFSYSSLWPGFHIGLYSASVSRRLFQWCDWRGPLRCGKKTAKDMTEFLR